MTSPEKRSTVLTADGQWVPAAAGIPPHAAEDMREVLSRFPVKDALEVGMAQGTSSLILLDGISGNLTSVDPFQHQQYQGAGVRSVEDGGHGARHVLLTEPDVTALPRLVSDGRHFDLVYIDGWHSFDYVLLDAIYADQLVAPGGLIGFNDCGWPSVHHVLSYISRHYSWWDELSLSTPRLYDASTMPKRAFRRLTRWPVNDRWFTKIADGQVPFNLHHRF